MDDIVFYQPPPVSNRQPLYHPKAIISLHLSPKPLPSLPACQTATLVSSLSQKKHSPDWHHQNNQQDFTASRNLSSSSNEDDDLFPDIEKLLSSTPAITDLNGNDNDDLINVDGLSYNMQQKELSVDQDYGGKAVDVVDNGTRGGSPTDSSRSTVGSSQDPINLSDDESLFVESETDYSSLELDLAAKNDPSSLYIADSHMADGEGFGSGATSLSDPADHQDVNNDNSVVDAARFTADLLTSIHQASPIRVNSEITPQNASYNGVNVAKEADDKRFDIFADDKVVADTCAMKRSRPTIVSSDNPASGGNDSIPEPQDNHFDSAQSPHPTLATVSHHHSNLTNNLMPQHHRRRDDIKVGRRKRLRTPALAGPARTASHTSALLKSNDSKLTQIVAGDIRDINQELDDDEGADKGSDYSNDEDYGEMSEDAAFKIQSPPRSRKRIKRAIDTTHNNAESSSARSLDISNQATAPTSSSRVQESDEIPVHGYLTLKTIDSKVVYCLTFSQDLFTEIGPTLQRHSISGSPSSSSDRTHSEQLPVQGRAMSRPVRNARFSSQEDKLLLQLKGDGLSWDEISNRFPERSKGTLQVHYSTKLKSCLKQSKNTRKRRRSN